MELDDLLQEFRLQEFEESMGILFPQETLSFEEIWKEVIGGNIIDVFAKVLERTIEAELKGLGSVKSVFLWLMILGIVGALLTNFIEIFDKAQVSELCFYFLYLMVSALMLKCFFEIMRIASEALDNIVLFVKLMIPGYLISVGVASGTVTVSVYYELVIVFIYLLENVFVKMVLPLISCHMVLSVVNGIWPGERLGLIIDLTKKMALWIVKAGVGIITGFSVIQGVISPSLDSVQNLAVKKMVSVVPGVGDAAKGILDITAASAIAVKNSIGVVLLILLIMLSLAPLVKIFLIAFVLKISAALMGTVSDKRITNLIVCDGHYNESYLLTTGASGSGEGGDIL